jgi:hypothetical protein
MQNIIILSVVVLNVVMLSVVILNVIMLCRYTERRYAEYRSRYVSYSHFDWTRLEETYVAYSLAYCTTVFIKAVKVL